MVVPPAIKKVLKAAIKAGGTTIRDYSSLNGEEGYFAQKLSVYGKEGKQCARCKKVNITKIVQAGRSTFFCPLCQEA